MRLNVHDPRGYSFGSGIEGRAVRALGPTFKRAALAAVLVAAMTAAGCATMPAGDSPTGPRTYHVDIGYENAKEGVEAEAFFPDGLTVNAGDTVIFTLRSHEPHTVTFNAPKPVPEPFMPNADRSVEANPVFFFPSPMPMFPPNPQALVKLAVSFDGSGFVNSGFIRNPGDTLSVKFSMPGMYQVLCLVHFEHMKGTITVNAAGTARPKTDAEYRAVAEAQLADFIAKADGDLAGVEVPAPVENADGSHTYSVLAGWGDTANGVDLMRYCGGENLKIKSGDTVSFLMGKNGERVPHTVTFNSGSKEPEFVVPQMRFMAPPRLFVNPVVLKPSPLPPAPYAGTGYYNSGLMITGGPTPQSYNVTFAKSGKFEYMCVIHDDDGMKGTITVQ